MSPAIFITKRLLSGFFLFATALNAEPRIFTDQFGRTITAELLSVEGDNIRIRRTDGQLFILPVAKLTQADQAFIKSWSDKSSAAETKTVTIDPEKIIVGMSRGKFDSRTLTKFDSYSHKHEDWGYSIQITNKHLSTIKDLRVEYNLFSRKFADTSSPTVITGVKKLKPLPGRESKVFRTDTAEVCKRRGSYFGINSMGEMRGIWLRIYVGDTLLIEQSSPESLMADEDWTKATKGE